MNLVLRRRAIMECPSAVSSKFERCKPHKGTCHPTKRYPIRRHVTKSSALELKHIQT